MSSYVKYENNSIKFYLNNQLVEELQSDQIHTPNTTYIKFNPDTSCTEFWVNGEKFREVS